MPNEIREFDSLIDLLEDLENREICLENRREAFSHFINSRARKLGIPLHGSFELTPLCNLDCKMCYVHLSKEQLGSRQLLTAGQWMSLIRQAVDAGMLEATLTGGECLLYPEFDQVYSYLQSLGIRVSLLTNGVLLDEERMKFLTLHRPKGIQITLYGDSDDVYQRVTGMRQFNAVMQAIERVKSAKIPLSIAITPNRYLEDGGERLLRFVHSLGVPFSVNTVLFPPREETGRTQDDDISVDAYIRLQVLRRMLQGVSVIPIDECELPLPPHKGLSKRGLLCNGGSNSFCVNWQGEMMPCASLNDIKAEPLKDGFMLAWQKIRGLVNSYPLPEECGECCYRSVCPSCVAAHKLGGEIGHASPQMCIRARKIVAAGLGKCI